jgi:uncharacterized damage-inducible protein DinB
MRGESLGFQPADIERFLDEFLDVEREALIGRLEEASARLAELAPQIPPDAQVPSSSWSAHEVLAHVVALSKLYGMLTYKIGSGALTEFDLLPMVHQRDAAGAALAQLDGAELLAMALADHRRTLDYLRGASAAELRRRCRLGEGREMSAGEVLRLPLVAHLEQHVRQLEAALQP